MAGGRFNKLGGAACMLVVIGMLVLMFPVDGLGQAEAREHTASSDGAASEPPVVNVWTYSDIFTSSETPDGPMRQPATAVVPSAVPPPGIACLSDLMQLRDGAKGSDAEEVDCSADMTGETLKGIPGQGKLKTFALLDDENGESSTKTETRAETSDSAKASAETAAEAKTKASSKSAGRTTEAKADANPVLDKEDERAIAKSVKDLAEAGYDCGFVFLDLASGKGIARNADELFYSASAFKAAFVLYILQNEKSKDLSDYDRSNIESTILWSSNGAYDSLAQSRMGKAYNDWLDGYGIEFDNVIPYYANVSAKSMARIWADLFQYLQSDSKNAKWLGKLLAKTSRSFIRSSLKGESVTVRNKAGWIGDSEYSATTDCAYIDEEGHPYLMVVLTDQPDSDASNRRAGQITKALFAARESLR